MADRFGIQMNTMRATKDYCDEIITLVERRCRGLDADVYDKLMVFLKSCRNRLPRKATVIHCDELRNQRRAEAKRLKGRK